MITQKWIEKQPTARLIWLHVRTTRALAQIEAQVALRESTAFFRHQVARELERRGVRG